MTSFSSQTLAADWQISPLTPVMTVVATGDQSLNFDDYDDMERGLQPSSQYPTLYPNVPDVFPVADTYSIPVGTTWAQVKSLFLNSAPGSVFWLEDGLHDWSGIGTSGITIDAPSDNPRYLLAESIHGATITVGEPPTSTLLFSGSGIVFAGIVDAPFAFNGEQWMRCTMCKFFGATNSRQVSARGDSSKDTQIGWCVEFDNNEYDGGNQDALFDKAIDLNAGDSVNDIDYPQNIRLHHNHFHSVTGGVENSLWFVGQGGHFLKVNLIIENNLIDAWLYEKEAYEMKCGQYIIRHNTFINQGDKSGHRLRSDSGIMFYGNWSEDNFNGDIAAATYNTAICFNFVKNIEDAVGIRMFPFHCEESSGYGNQDNRLMQHNVSSGAGRCLLASEAKTTVPIGYQSDSVMEGNHFYSAHIANSDADGAGNYDRASDQGLGQNLTETQWRAANTWGTNTYTNQFLVPTMNAVDPDLFDGPGDDITVDDVYQIYGFDLFGSLYGQPSQIKMPSWWKA
jgi:hypothetical protein